MPPEIQASTGIDPKQVAANLTKGMVDRSNGKTAAKGPDVPADGDEKWKPVAVDPNAGKEKYDVEGKDVWLTPAEARAYVQKGIAFEPRVSELDRIKREFVAFEQAMLENPGAILLNLAKRANVPIKTMVEKVLTGTASDEVKEVTGQWYWENVAKRQRMDPKDLQILEQEERIKSMEAQEKSKSEAAIAAENRARVDKAIGEISAQIQDTLKELGIANLNTPAAVRITKEIADVMRLSHLTKQPCTPKIAAEKVKARIHEYQKQFYDVLEPEQLVAQIGKENAEKVRKFLLKQVQDVEKGTQQVSKSSGKPVRRNERETLNLDDFHEYLDDLKRSSK